VCLVHCEDEELVAIAGDRLKAEGRADGGLIPLWRNREAEMTAVARIAELARATGARVVVAHASHRAILARVAVAREAGADVWVETCPQYLTLYEEEVHEAGALRKFTPPARARCERELDEMWAALEDGAHPAVHLISSDHAPSTLAQKNAGTIWDAPFGLPGLDTTSAILIDAACRGRLPFERVVALYSAAPAMIYGLGPAKGSLEPGADADLVLVDPRASRILGNEAVRSRAGWTPFAGRRVRGRVTETWVRGKRVFADGEVVGMPGGGRLVRRRVG
jgi:dihydroorotase-like cyclic amidohydrolase